MWFSIQFLWAWFPTTYIFQLSFRIKSCGQLYSSSIKQTSPDLTTLANQPRWEEGWKDNSAHPDKSPPFNLPGADKSPPRTICSFSPLMVSLSGIINPPRPISRAFAWGQRRRFSGSGLLFIFEEVSYLNLLTILALSKAVRANNIATQIIDYGNFLLLSSSPMFNRVQSRRQGPQIGWWTRLTGRKEGRNHFQGWRQRQTEVKRG